MSGKRSCFKCMAYDHHCNMQKIILDVQMLVRLYL